MTGGNVIVILMAWTSSTSWESFSDIIVVRFLLFAVRSCWVWGVAAQFESLIFPVTIRTAVTLQDRSARITASGISCPWLSATKKRSIESNMWLCAWKFILCCTIMSSRLALLLSCPFHLRYIDNFCCLFQGYSCSPCRLMRTLHSRHGRSRERKPLRTVLISTLYQLDLRVGIFRYDINGGRDSLCDRVVRLDALTVFAICSRTRRV